MTAEINELFEEGITRSGELSDAADEAMGTIDEMAKGGRGVGAARREGCGRTAARR